MADLIDSIKNMPGGQNQVAVTVQPAVIDPVVVRAEKVQRLAMNMCKSNRIKISRLVVILISRFSLRNLGRN